jgi:GTP cyclohydrolase II
MQSRQAPRRVRLANDRLRDPAPSPPRATLSLPRTNGQRRRSSAAATGDLVRTLKAAGAPPAAKTNGALEPVKVVCHARTRVPTPHGDVLLHLFKNNRDDKEHLAFVFDRPQLAAEGDPDLYLRSRSLDAVWRPGETDDERIVRGAYVGRLAPQNAVASSSRAPVAVEVEPPLVRIHSECFTGETIGSQRCDCGEQLDEAFRLAATASTGRGIVVYLRQEGRGIGLLEKLRAYNLQDLGHDTVTANLLLGHGADMRTYAVAAAILADLGVGDVRLLTNNPDKIEQLATEGVRVVERVPMVPRHWRARSPRRGAGTTSASEEDDEGEAEAEEREARKRRMGVGMIGAGETASPELERYLATKAARMGHLLERPVLSQAPSAEDVRAVVGRKKRVPAPVTAPRSPSPEPLADSIASLASVECDDGCECRQ